VACLLVRSVFCFVLFLLRRRWVVGIFEVFNERIEKKKKKEERESENLKKECSRKART